MLRYLITITLSSFLLFSVQPLIAKQILPWFGGTPVVWTTCMVFFQALLLAGYCYAHFVARLLKTSAQWWVHTALLLITVILLNINPNPSLMAHSSNAPTWAMVKILAFSIGLPFLVLSSTGPLVQRWQSLTHVDRSPFRLYSLSNVASLLALVGYPFLIEPYLSIREQTRVWSAGFYLFAGFSCAAGLYASRLSGTTNNAIARKEQVRCVWSLSGSSRPVFWFLLPMTSAVVLLGSTNLITQDVAAVPFLWLVPLSLYLASYIITFDHSRWYSRTVFVTLLFVSTPLACYFELEGLRAGIAIQIAAYATVCFACCMVCHGELHRLKPDPHLLTGFYIVIAAGSVLGSVFVATIAPRIFTGLYEFHFGLSLCFFLAFAVELILFNHGQPSASGNLLRYVNRIITFCGAIMVVEILLP